MIEGRLHLRIDPRADGMPWPADSACLAAAGETALEAADGVAGLVAPFGASRQGEPSRG